MDANVNKGSESGHVRDDSRQLHTWLEVIYLVDILGETEFLGALARVTAGLGQFLQNIIDRWKAERGLVLRSGSWLAGWLTGRIGAFLSSTLLVLLLVPALAWNALTMSGSEIVVYLALIFASAWVSGLRPFVYPAPLITTDNNPSQAFPCSSLH